MPVAAYEQFTAPPDGVAVDGEYCVAPRNTAAEAGVLYRALGTERADFLELLVLEWFVFR